jgi:DNA polymerase-3 subunit gamma/tau
MLKNKNKINLATTLLAEKPLLKDKTIIQFNIANKVQEEEILQEKSELLAFLKKELKNFHITLETVINKTESGKQAYTTSDKFKIMVQKNPELNKMKQLFDLDTDY